MSQPTPYSRQFDFTGWSASRPSDQQPGTSMDAEFNALKVTLDAILANLVQLQRDDGAPRNSIVTLDTLATDVLTTIGSGQGWVPRGAWVTATAYSKGDVVAENGSTYVATVDHTSGVFATDEAADKWVAIFGAVTSGAIEDGSITTAKLADGAVTAPKIGFTALDLTGSFRAQAGIAGGSAIAGVYAVAGQEVSGDVYSSIARTTKNQGKVGFRMDGGASGAVWEWIQPSNANYSSITYTISGITYDILSLASGGVAGLGAIAPSTSALGFHIGNGGWVGRATDNGRLDLCANVYFDGVNWRLLRTDLGAAALILSGGETNGVITAYRVVGGAAGAVAALTAQFSISADGVLPGGDNAFLFGNSSRRWQVIYAATGSINTSDARHKEWRGGLNAQELAVARRISGKLGIYRWLSAIAEKGDEARLHVGALAQEVCDAFIAEGLDAFRYGMVCYDEWSESVDPDSGEVTLAGDRFSLRYEELLCFMMSAFDARMKRLESRLNMAGVA